MYSIIPPYMLKKIIERGTPEQKSRALRSLHFGEQARHLRSMVAKKWRPDTEIQKVLQRLVYDAETTEALPGKLVLKEGEETADPDVKAVYDAAGFVYNLYNQKFDRNSLDDEGMPIIQTIHFGDHFNNAFFDGYQMVYGDGDGEIFSKFFSDIDVIGHELSHGVVSFEADLIYQGQSGALNESFADAFGIMVKQFALNQKAEDSDWLIGENVVLGPYAMRSMKNPGTAYKDHPILGDDPQPSDMAHYLDLGPYDDNGGVHLNSGIPNRVFCLACLNIGGYAWEKMGKIWYAVLCDELQPDSDFKDMMVCTLDIAADFYRSSSPEFEAVRDAWKQVGVF